jgi:uncharacterized small protein (DUF1192 family)
MFEEGTQKKPDRPLEDMSLEELAERIVNLKAEIERCEAEIKKKEASKRAADDIFGG